MRTKTLTQGTDFEGYKIRALLGEGATAKVYWATDTRSGKELALKVLRHGFSGVESRRRRFEREARAMAACRHKNIIGIHEVGRRDEVPFIAMELVRGESLRCRLDRDRLPISVVMDLALQIASGLEAAHASGIVHRDLKPENIMIGDDGTAKILDFGLSKSLVHHETTGADARETIESLTLPGTILGTLEYMSPEQASGRGVDYRSDQFGFGSILYEMIAGYPAFHRETAPQILAAVIEGHPIPLVQAPESLRAIVDTCLRKAPEDRFADVSALVRALAAAAADRGLARWVALGGRALASLAGALSL